MTLDDLAEWCAMRIGQPQYYRIWWLKRFSIFTDYIDHDQYSSYLHDVKYIQYNEVAVLGVCGNAARSRSSGVLYWVHMVEKA